MAEPKTKVNDASVTDFLDSIPDERVRADCRTIAKMMEKAAKAPPRMWGANIVGFGTHRQVYANGKEADWMLIAFSPRKQNIVLYQLGGFAGREELMAKLGKHSTGKGCLYLKSLDGVHLPTLEKLIQASVKQKKAGGAGSE